jgi:hypothetical protein
MLNEIKPASPLFTINDTVNQEQALNCASDLLRCIITLACESGDSTLRTRRDLECSVGYMAEIAKAMVDRSIDCR